MHDDRSPGRVAWGICAALWLAAWPGDTPTSAPCRVGWEVAAEVTAESARTTVARCGRGGGGAELRGPARRLFGLPVDPNHADRLTLETLPGIGPARAAAVLESRRRRVFCRIGDLERVPGIGPLTRRRIEPWIRLAPALACGDTPSG